MAHKSVPLIDAVLAGWGRPISSSRISFTPRTWFSAVRCRIRCKWTLNLAYGLYTTASARHKQNFSCDGDMHRHFRYFAPGRNHMLNILRMLSVAIAWSSSRDIAVFFRFCRWRHVFP